MANDEALLLALILIQLLIFSSFMYQVFKEYRRARATMGEEVAVERAFTEVKQLEDDVGGRVDVGRVVDVELDQVDLNAEEAKVLSLILSRAGGIYQSEVARELNIPKSTLSRIIRRLQERGLVIIKRRGRYNYVEVTDRDYVAYLLDRLRKIKGSRVN